MKQLAKMTVPWSLNVLYATPGSLSDVLRLTLAFFLLSTTPRLSYGQQCQDYTTTNIDCEFLGFWNAHLNSCGYCVGGSTGLEEDFGKDCKGICGGQATFDCMGICGGTGFLDPCSSECIAEDTGPRTVDTQSGYRDCMGRCIDPNPKAPPSPYVNDSCGVCLRGGSGKDSQYKDCTGTCYLPSEEEQMAEQKCGQCIGGSSPNKRADFVDGCGNCRSAKASCECDNGESPLDMVCVFRNASDPENPVVGAPSPGIGNGPLIFSNGQVSFTCRVPKGLPEGEYYVNARLSRLGREEHRNLTLHVFNSDIAYAKMEPNSAPYRILENKNATSVRVKFSGGNVPKYPLYCRVMKADVGRQKMIPVYPSGIATQLNECEIPLPPQSQDYIIFPTLDGLNAMSTNFSFLFYATRPQIKQSYMHSDGGAAIVFFDRDVNISALLTCEDMLTDETLNALGGADYLSCRWATKHQLVIFLPKREKNSVKLQFRSSNFTEDGQRYIQDVGDDLKTDAKVQEVKDSPIYIAITGPNVIPYCGDFELFAHYSWANGVPDAFQWTVQRNDSVKISDKDMLAMEVKRTTGSTLSLASELFDFGIQYTFTLKVGQGKSAGIATHQVIRHENPGPIVLLYSTTMLQLEPVTVSQSDIVIYVETIIPDPERCPNDSFHEIRYTWRVDRPDVKLDPCSLDSGTVYRVQPYTLPANANVTFTIRAYMFEIINNGAESLPQLDYHSESSVSFTVAPANLQAVLRGTPTREVGDGTASNHYSLIVDASPSSHPTIPVTYLWSCVDDKLQPCYDFGARATSALLVDPTVHTGPILNISTESIQPQRTLNFSVTLYRADNGSAAEPSTAFVLVNTLEHVAPMAWLHEIRVRDRTIYEVDEEAESFVVPAGQPVVLHVKFRFVHLNRVQTHWDVNGFPINHGAIGSRAGHEGDSFLSLPEGSTVAHGQYHMGMRVCEGAQHCTQLRINLFAKPGVALCRLTIPSFEEVLEVYNRSEAHVLGCSVPLGIHPLTYQLFVERENNSWIPVSTVQHSPLIPFFVPLPTNNETTLAVAVCDRFEQCTYFYNRSLPTVVNYNETYSRQEMFANIHRLVAAERHLEAAAILVSISLGRDDLNQSMLTEVEKKEIFDSNEQLLTSVFVSTSKRDLSPGEINLMYECMKLVMRGGNVDQKAGAIEATGAITDQVLNNKIEVTLVAMEEAYKAVRRCGQDHKSDPQIKRNVEYAQKIIETVIASRLPKGQTHRFTTREPIVFPSTAPTNSTRQGVPDAVILFKKSINTMFNSWQCGGSAKEPKMCNAVVVVVNVYPYNPYSDSTRGTMISPVASITFRKPDTGEEHKVSGLKDAIHIHFRQTANFTRTVGYISSCYRWHERNEEWDTDMVKLLGTVSNVIQCATEGTGSFMVFNEKEGLSTAAIAGIVVACMMFVFIVAALMMFMMHKKQAQEAALKNARANGHHPPKPAAAGSQPKGNAVAPSS
ncbi:hypothetical protein BIW11_00609 [Tropilaelaps mercedesae]|uniref:PKD/REJ-like domain-containing protein n=1 Tax=Tropilaelaps mercedesae TaxID=418985 RepID=A0A1V9XS76_9ACAR|nr:hypothetical protein BIW11_00609 [Tropilaelaps mercedesae]